MQSTGSRAIFWQRSFWIKSGHQARPSWPAHVIDVEIGKAQAVFGESVEVGRFNFAAVTAQVGEPHVVCDDVDNVGRSFCAVDLMEEAQRESDEQEKGGSGHL